MQLVGERTIPDPPKTTPTLPNSNGNSNPSSLTFKPLPPGTPTQTVADPRQEFITRAAWRAGVLGALNLAALILSLRLILLIATGGAIMLTYLALGDRPPFALVALAIYCATVLMPLVWLAARK